MLRKDYPVERIRALLGTTSICEYKHTEQKIEPHANAALTDWSEWCSMGTRIG